jgi:hypothetical protein
MTAEKPIPSRHRDPWNKGRMIRQKRPLPPKDVWTSRVRLQIEERRRDLAMFNLAIVGKLRIDDVWLVPPPAPPPGSRPGSSGTGQTSTRRADSRSQIMLSSLMTSGGGMLMASSQKLQTTSGEGSRSAACRPCTGRSHFRRNVSFCSLRRRRGYLASSRWSVGLHDILSLSTVPQYLGFRPRARRRQRQNMYRACQDRPLSAVPSLGSSC